ncbi:unnamed protein product [Miscanthus lutarioriparius]|uniref:Uncharacterized protein n=1 Tax=Miscanthus lutarioriparius TaxID=422564 RepID=A0A811MDQ7_9POAL|nr:unnamed protein product [Miscanthus lutarioriparius]
MARQGVHAAVLAVPCPCAALKKEASLRTAPRSRSRPLCSVPLPALYVFVAAASAMADLSIRCRLAAAVIHVGVQLPRREAHW